MTQVTVDHLTRISFSIYENKGVYALLIGSGLSRAAEIPTGWEITINLIRRVAIAQGEEEQLDWVAWYRERTGKEPDYSELVGELGSSRDERRSILHSYIEPSDEDRAEGRKLPTAAHYAVADLVQSGYVRAVITTNFDRLLESALRERGVEPTVVASPDMLKGAEPLIHSDCFLFKLHGDYKDARILNTEAELSKYPREYDLLLDRIFDEHGLVVCGWSGEWDHGLRAAILRNPARRYSMFWASRGEPGEQARELILHRGGLPVPITDADDFFGEIRNRIQTLAQTHRQNPQSIDLLVNSTKRYLAKPEYRIQLDELIKSEANSLVEKLNSANLTAQGSRDQEVFQQEFQRRVGIYEAASESLACMFGVLGRWGNDKEITPVMEIVRLLLRHANEEISGLITVAWLNIRSYPAVLLVTAYGIGLVHNKRWCALHRFLSSEIESGVNEDPHRIVETLFLESWAGGENGYWQQLEGMERHKTALSEHLCMLYEKWGDSFLGVVSNFEQLYETWEILSSLVYCECYGVEDLQPKSPEGTVRDFVWAPVGRSGLNNRTRSKIIRQIQNDEFKQALLGAGFGKGQSEHLEEAIGNLQRIAGNLWWR